METPSNSNVSNTGVNYTVYLTGIPPNQNSARKLAEVFGRFGNILDIEMSYKGNPQSATIIYAQREEAATAMEWWNTLDKTTSARTSQSASTSTGSNSKGAQCDHCGKILASASSRDSHIKRMHTEVECDVCHQRLESNNAYRLHFNKMHTDKKPKNVNVTTSQSMNDTSTVNDTILPVNSDQLERAIEKVVALRVKCHSLKIRLNEHSQAISKGKKKQRRLKRQRHENEQKRISLQEEVNSLHRKVELNDIELMGLRQNEQEKDAELATLNKTNKLLQTKNDQLNQNWRNEQMKVDMLLQTLSKTIHPAKN